MQTANLFKPLPELGPDESVTSLLQTTGFRLERIVSNAHATPAGEWYDQDQPEWVLLLQGCAGVLIEGESQARCLNPGDYLHIPSHVKHRVEWTDATQATVWLALHYRQD